MQAMSRTTAHSLATDLQAPTKQRKPAPRRFAAALGVSTLLALSAVHVSASAQHSPQADSASKRMSPAKNQSAQTSPALGRKLLAAARVGNIEQVRAALKQGALVNMQDEQGNTALLLATAGNHIEVARSLLLDGADPNLKNAMSDSAYLLAGAQGRLEILRMTLSYGADLKSTNRFGGTALIPACERGHVETVRALLAAGVAPDHVNRLGWTCLIEAIVLSDGGPRHQDIVSQLISAGANLNLADKDGVTPLAHALARGQSDTARLLQAAGAR